MNGESAKKVVLDICRGKSDSMVDVDLRNQCWKFKNVFVYIGVV